MAGGGNTDTHRSSRYEGAVSVILSSRDDFAARLDSRLAAGASAATPPMSSLKGSDTEHRTQEAYREQIRDGSITRAPHPPVRRACEVSESQ